MGAWSVAGELIRGGEGRSGAATWERLVRGPPGPNGNAVGVYSLTLPDEALEHGDLRTVLGRTGPCKLAMGLEGA